MYGVKEKLRVSLKDGTLDLQGFHTVVFLQQPMKEHQRIAVLRFHGKIQSPTIQDFDAQLTRHHFLQLHVPEAEKFIPQELIVSLLKTI
ncbi:hypothetical protein IscW_ISCW000754 [Ixodes scapularis]|uniref:Uncharacterized protein n=1 Tax=Ixodes scapularis TaxID=6945 RepID=B7P3W8_IXOSC|nr:hypothetical protein IscW_ISCW000754 [Ixodes scapularis]|eukprot:XP_002404706.1 hypothetical protein IscW_ISCW000754 [Ixodes scapularis]